MERKGYDHEILLLQGGGALGAYQAGVYEGLVEAGVAPTWVVGISIGAINASLIVGNPPEQRVERLREFWRRISVNVGPTLPAWLELISTGGQPHGRHVSRHLRHTSVLHAPQCHRLVSGWDKIRPATGPGIVVYRPTEALPPPGPVAMQKKAKSEPMRS